MPKARRPSGGRARSGCAPGPRWSGSMIRRIRTWPLLLDSHNWTPQHQPPLHSTVTFTKSAVPLPELAVSGREISRGSPVARLTIESIDLDEIVLEGVGPLELNGGPGHFPGSVLPGGAGNSILSAHRDRHFRRVGELGVAREYARKPGTASSSGPWSSAVSCRRTRRRSSRSRKRR